MRKTISMLIIVAMIIMLGTIPVHAATNGIELTPSKTTLKAGDTFTVTLKATCNEGMNGVIGKEENDGFKLNFDSNKLELVSGEAKVLTDANGGGDTIALIYLGLNTITEEEVYVWNFKVKDGAEAGSTEISTTEIEINALDDSKTTVEPKTITLQISGGSTEDPTNPDDQSGGNGETNPPSDESGTTDDQNTPGDTDKKDDNKNTNTNTNTDTDKKSVPANDSKKSGSGLPYAGDTTLVAGLIVVGVIVAVVAFKKVQKYKGI